MILQAEHDAVLLRSGKAFGDRIDDPLEAVVVAVDIEALSLRDNVLASVSIVRRAVCGNKPHPTLF